MAIKTGPDFAESRNILALNNAGEVVAAVFSYRFLLYSRCVLVGVASSPDDHSPIF